MNVRKQVDYSAIFMALDVLIAAGLPQMKLYCEIGRVVSDRPEKGAAVMAAEYLHGAYPEAAGFSPRNLRRMREFYRTYETTPEILAEAMTIGWTQNVVILEADLTLLEKSWYIRAVKQFGWFKLTLLEKIEAGESVPDRVRSYQYRGDRQPFLSSDPPKSSRTRSTAPANRPTS